MLKSRPQIAIYLEKSKIVVGDFRSPKPNFYENLLQEDLYQALSKIITSLPASNYLFIVSSDFSYTITFPFTDKDVERDQVYAELSSHVPETFLPMQFDWKKLDSSHIEAVVLTHNFFSVIEQLTKSFPAKIFSTLSFESLKTELNLKGEITTITKDILLQSINNLVLKGADSATLNVDLTHSSPPKISNYNLILGLVFFAILFISSFILLKYLRT